MFSGLADTAVSLKLINNFVRKVFPLVNAELSRWEAYARLACPELQSQALASIRDKKFHCQGGSIYSLYKNVPTADFVRLVVSLQTISDYLDNLCDRAGIYDEQAFSHLHLAMTDALAPDRPLQPYYQYYPFKEDGGYLPQLVTACRQQVAKLPSYDIVKPYVLKLAGLYSRLQTLKHLEPTVREEKMLHWIKEANTDYPEITPWEFAAATGSTLGMFMLCAAASTPRLTPDEGKKIADAYFPWISGLHILLDYFIDRAEDKANGDLNFVSYYSNEQEVYDRLCLFWRQALAKASSLSDPIFARTVVHGLSALYLSDPKTNHDPERAIRAKLLRTCGLYTTLVYYLCRLLRQKKNI